MRSPTPASSARSSRLVIGGIAVVIIAALAWWLWPAAEAPVEDSPSATVNIVDGRLRLTTNQMRLQGITSAPVEPATHVPVPGLPAQSAPPLASSAQVVTPYAGVVTRILVDEGGNVEAGQPLAQVRSRELLTAQNDLTRARAEAEAARRQAERDAKLLAEGIIAAARAEQSRARADAAQATYRQASGAMTQLSVVSDGQPGEYALLSPMSGVVMQRRIAPGEALEEMQPAFVIAEPGRLDINVRVPIRYRSELRPGLEVELPDGSRAQVAAISADTDPGSQTLRVRATLEGNSGFLPGQQFSVILWLDAPEGSVTIPSSALVTSSSGQAVFRLDEGQIGRVAIDHDLGGDDRIRVVQASGLAPGMDVVTSGTSTLKSMIPAE